MMLNKITLAVTAIMAGVQATPTPIVAASGVDTTPELAKRARQGMHFVNCGNGAYSAVVWCNDDTNCNFVPASANLCRRGWVPWESGTKSCTFPTGVTATWNIISDAQQRPNFSAVGDAYNGQSWVVYKDDKHRMYTDAAGNACTSIYYLLN